MARAACVLALVSIADAARPMKWESLMLVKAAAEKGDHEAQFLIGLQYKVGDGLPRDRAEAAKWLRKAAESGNAEAQYALGDLYADDSVDDGLANPAEAAKWIKAAAAQGEPEAKARLEADKARADEKRSDPTAKPAGATEPAEPAAPTPPPGNSREMDEDPAETMRWSLLLSGLRGAEAFLLRGYMLENGVVVNRDLPAAVESYRKAAKLGDARAEYQLGLMYREGRGVPQDVGEAGRWFAQAAAHGSAEAATVLARQKESAPGAAPPGESVKPQSVPARKP